MNLERRTSSRLFLSFGILLLASAFVSGQDYVQRLRHPARVRGFIGGETHDSYVIRARKGQLMTVQISWRRERGEAGPNHAQFFVADSGEFSGDSAVKFGAASNHEKRWRGRIPKTQDYYIYVNAYPTAHYTLTVRLQ